MRKALQFVVVAVACFISFAPYSAETATVTRVVDGDTLVVDIAGQKLSEIVLVELCQVVKRMGVTERGWDQLDFGRTVCLHGIGSEGVIGICHLSSASGTVFM